MKEKIRSILLEHLMSNYDNGNIEDGGIGGGNECIEALHKLMEENLVELYGIGKDGLYHPVFFTQSQFSFLKSVAHTEHNGKETVYKVNNDTYVHYEE